jgi:prepilin-type N-terminal cleavage/methylation domain-containing protein
VNKKGFTLIETLVALMILAGTSVVLYQSWGGSFRAVKKGRLYNTITLLLQKKVVEFEVKAKTEKVDEVVDEEGDFGSDYPDFKWEIKVKPFTVPPINPNGNGLGETNKMAETVLKVMSDYFEKAVREVLVTVVYTVGEKKLKYSVSTIYVDYTQDIPNAL